MIPAQFAGLCDDAALFPGNAPLSAAVPDHLKYRAAPFSALVGPFVFPMPQLSELFAPAECLEVSLTAPQGPRTAADAVAQASAIDNVTIVAVEVALPPGEISLAGLDAVPDGIDVYIEVPRDQRRPAVFEAIGEHGYHAKFRTGGTSADLYPGETELAAAIYTAVAAGIRFKATAGLHHAIRNTDPATGFEQHGYLNLLWAAQAAADGADPADLEVILALRDPDAVVPAIAALSGSRVFGSFGTCSITEPLDDLIALGLIRPDPDAVSTTVTTKEYTR